MAAAERTDGDLALLPPPRTSSEILWSIQKLDTLGRALYVAAHPDDENTSLISYLSLGRKYDTAYLSLTRGDGGQNLIGPELRDGLGVIRTQELLEARRIDGGRQFFSRAKDFGYSKTPEETFSIWDREAVLADAVWVIRRFRPDVIITRFNDEPGFTHGHHTASTLIALEAFEAAADPSRFSEQLEWVEPWQATRVVWNTSTWFFRRSGERFDASDYLAVEVGGYEPLLGRSYNEIASASRSMHRSQGFGTSVERGSRTEYFQLLAGEPMANDLFDGVSTRWDRVGGGEAIARQVEALLRAFQVGDPAASVPGLLELRGLLRKNGSDWARSKLRDVDGIVLACLGLDVKALSPERYVEPGGDVAISVEAVNRSRVEVVARSLRFRQGEEKESLELSLPFNERVTQAWSVTVPDDLPAPQPYWLREEGDLGMFAVDEQRLIGAAENEPPLSLELELDVAGETLRTLLPLQHREVDPARGEMLHQTMPLPAASVAFVSPVALFPNYEERSLEVAVTALLREVGGELRLELPPGWTSHPETVAIDSLKPGERRVVAFAVAPPARSEEVTLSAVLDTGRARYGQAVELIDYEHIREQTVFTPASTKAVSLEVKRQGERVGYLPGAGDAVPQSIREIGYEVRELDAERFVAGDLEGLDTVVIGIRAYNTVDQIDRIMPELFAFVEQGGTVIAQYNTSHRLKTERLAPYELQLSRDRVTDETAELRPLAPGHPVLNEPNAIGPEDFAGWTQERGLYFPNRWDPAFEPIFSSADPGESPSEGSLLVARYGEGHFVYTGLSWFRQLPAGVPGAYRLFANLLSLGHGEGR